MQSSFKCNLKVFKIDKLKIINEKFNMFGVESLSESKDEDKNEEILKNDKIEIKKSDYHKKMALERIKNMQKKFQSENIEAIEYLEKIKVQDTYENKNNESYAFPIIGYEKVKFLKTYDDLNSIDNNCSNFSKFSKFNNGTCMICHKTENYIDFDLDHDLDLDLDLDLNQNVSNKLFLNTKFSICCNLIKSNIFYNVNYCENNKIEMNQDELYYHVDCYRDYKLDSVKSNIYYGGCGHLVHNECWKTKVEQILNQLNNTTEIEGLEFFCPLCESYTTKIVPYVVTNYKKMDLNDLNFNFKEQLIEYTKFVNIIQLKIDNNKKLDENDIKNYDSEPLYQAIKSYDLNNYILLLINFLVYSIQSTELNNRADKISVTSIDFIENYKNNVLKNMTKYIIYLFQNYFENSDKYKNFILFTLNHFLNFQNLLFKHSSLINNNQFEVLQNCDFFKMLIINFIFMITFLNYSEINKLQYFNNIYTIEKFNVCLFYCLHGLQTIKLINTINTVNTVNDDIEEYNEIIIKNFEKLCLELKYILIYC